MKREIVINPEYNKLPALVSLLENITPESALGEKIYQNRRNTLWSHHIEGIGKIVIKLFRYDALRQLLFCFNKRSKARLAYDNALTLLANGIDTPAPIAFVDVTSGVKVLYSAIITSFTPDEEITIPLEEDRAFATALADMTARMHRNGILHHDMNSSNILYNKVGNKLNLSLIDLNRMEKKDAVSFKDEMDDLVRFTGKLDTFVNVIYPYARFMGHDVEPFVRKATTFKIRHDANWTRKKKLKRLFR